MINRSICLKTEMEPAVRVKLTLDVSGNDGATPVYVLKVEDDDDGYVLFMNEKERLAFIELLKI